MRLMRVGRILICVYNTNKDSLLFLLLFLLLLRRMLRVGRILICVHTTNKDCLLLLLWARLSSARGLNGSVLRVLRVERIPLDFHE